MEHSARMHEKLIWEMLIDGRAVIDVDKEVQDCDQASEETTGPEETEVGIREEGSSIPRDE